jgi:hypothetical protein
MNLSNSQDSVEKGMSSSGNSSLMIKRPIPLLVRRVMERFELRGDIETSHSNILPLPSGFAQVSTEHHNL